MDDRAAQRIKAYYTHAKPGYDLLLSHSQHLGYRGPGERIDEYGAQRKMHEEIAKGLGTKRGMRILDVGCGQGVVAVFLAKEWDAKVTGIDIFPPALSSARKRGEAAHVAERVRF